MFYFILHDRSEHEATSIIRKLTDELPLNHSDDFYPLDAHGISILDYLQHLNKIKRDKVAVVISVGQKGLDLLKHVQSRMFSKSDRYFSVCYDLSGLEQLPEILHGLAVPSFVLSTEQIKILQARQNFYLHLLDEFPFEVYSLKHVITGFPDELSFPGSLDLRKLSVCFLITPGDTRSPGNMSVNLFDETAARNYAQCVLEYIKRNKVDLVLLQNTRTSGAQSVLRTDSQKFHIIDEKNLRKFDVLRDQQHIIATFADSNSRIIIDELRKASTNLLFYPGISIQRMTDDGKKKWNSSLMPFLKMGKNQIGKQKGKADVLILPTDAWLSWQSLGGYKTIIPQILYCSTTTPPYVMKQLNADPTTRILGPDGEVIHPFTRDLQSSTRPVDTHPPSHQSCRLTTGQVIQKLQLLIFSMSTSASHSSPSQRHHP